MNASSDTSKRSRHAPRVTKHACFRWSTRVAGRSTHARLRIHRALESSILIPNRYAGQWHARWNPHLVSRQRQHGIRYRFYPGALLITKSSGTVLTVLESTDEDLGSVLVWLMMGEWV